MTATKAIWPFYNRPPDDSAIRLLQISQPEPQERALTPQLAAGSFNLILEPVTQYQEFRKGQDPS